MKPTIPEKSLQMFGILIILAVFATGTLATSAVNPRSIYLPPGAKTESKKRQESRERVRYNRHRAKQMLYDDLRYREAESEFRYRDQKRKLEIEERKRRLERDR